MREISQMPDVRLQMSKVSKDTVDTVDTDSSTDSPQHPSKQKPLPLNFSTQLMASVLLANRTTAVIVPPLAEEMSISFTSPIVAHSSLTSLLSTLLLRLLRVTGVPEAGTLPSRAKTDILCACCCCCCGCCWILCVC
jgi:hypothetical protein